MDAATIGHAGARPVRESEETRTWSQTERRTRFTVRMQSARARNDAVKRKGWWQRGGTHREETVAVPIKTRFSRERNAKTLSVCISVCVCVCIELDIYRVIVGDT